MPNKRRSTASIRVKATNPQDIAAHISPDMFRDAYEAGMGLSAWMERLNPSTDEDLRRGYDAFSRVMEAKDIYTNSMPEAGVWADVYDDVFTDTAQDRLLGLEWINRRWREAKFRKPAQFAGAGARDIYMATDYPPGTYMRPYIDAAAPRWTQLQPAIPLERLLAMTTPIQGIDYRSIYLQNVDPNLKRMVRVGESTEPPRMKLTTSSHTIQLSKYGRILEASYEVLRRQRLDRIAMEIALMAIQAEVDKAATVYDILVNGDGNPNTAATNYNLTALDPTASTSTPTPPYNITLRAWLNFKSKFVNPYMLTTAIVTADTAVALQLLNTGSANIPLVYIQAASGFGGFEAINPSLRDNVALGWTPDALPNKIIGFDSRRAVERVTEIGSDIQEVERHATTQTQDMVFTETEGYDILDISGLAVAVMNLTA
jgi:hypothetical protein